MKKTNSSNYLNNNYTALLDDTLTLPNTSHELKILFIIGFIGFVIIFDLSIYIFLSDVIIKSFFISNENLFYDKFNFIGLFASYFIARPVGGYFIGKYGDVKGRKPALNLALTIFLFSILLTIFLPTYIQIGITAPLFLIGLRLVQGAAFGTILVLLWVYIAENIARKKLSFYIGIVLGCLTLGAAVCALFTHLLRYYLTDINLINYGWRFAYIASALFCFVALTLSRKLDETYLFNYYKSSAGPVKLSKFDGVPNINMFNSILMTAVLSFIAFNLIFLTIMLLPKLILLQFSINVLLLNIANLTGIFGMLLGMVAYGWYGGKFGLGTSIIVGSFLLGISTIAFFYYLQTSGGNFIVPLYGFLGFCSGIVSLCVVIKLHLFPIHKRLTYLGVIVNLMGAISGLTLPIMLFYTTELVSFSPAIYYIFICLCTFIIGIHIKSNMVFDELRNIVD